jgi:4-hydroxy-2-oxoheptanedioate aldolase
LATFVLVPRLEIIEIAATAGFDVVILDLEHGAYTLEALPPLVAACEAAGVTCAVRVSGSEPQAIGAALDTGVSGVIVPHIGSGAAASSIVAAARFAPDGERGANPYVRAATYSADQSYFAEANKRTAIIAMVEGRQGIASIDDILETDGLNAVFLGPVDISMAVGVPGQPEHPRVLETVEGIIERAHARAVSTAVFAPNPSAASRWMDRGVHLVALSVDTALILDGFRAAVAELQQGHLR